VSTPSDPFAAVAALPGVLDAVTSARTAVDALLGHRLLRRRSAEVTAEIGLRAARASAALEGADWPLEEIRRRTGFADDPEGRIVAGTLRISAELGTLLDTWRAAPLQVVARLHVLAAADVLEAQKLGRPREAGRSLADRLQLGPLPSPEEVTARLNGLAKLLVGRSEAPAIVVAAIVHGELQALRPFEWGNGPVARAAERLVLVSRGLDPKSLISPEVGHAELGAEKYATALEAYTTGTAEGVASWVKHCAEAVGRGAQEGLAVCEALLRG
jgi:Fic family protein